VEGAWRRLRIHGAKAGLGQKLRGNPGRGAQGCGATNIYLVATSIAKMEKQHKLADPNDGKIAVALQKDLDGVARYVPKWVIYAVAVALGLGTTVG